jgi:hypothetical protein
MPSLDGVPYIGIGNGEQCPWCAKEKVEFVITAENGMDHIVKHLSEMKD